MIDDDRRLAEIDELESLDRVLVEMRILEDKIEDLSEKLNDLVEMFLDEHGGNEYAD